MSNNTDLKVQRESSRQVNKLLELEAHASLTTFDQSLDTVGIFPLTATGITTLQVNVGRVCNQTCKHCHVSAGPKRKESMPVEVFEKCISVLENTDIPVVDITGGAPELNPNFRWFVREVRSLNRHVIDRCNLTVMFEEGQEDLTSFLAENEVEIVASLPAFNKSKTDAQRGDDVFDKSIQAMRRLNEEGYGHEASGLTLNLVTNPTGAFLPGSQCELEKRWRTVLKAEHDIVFNNLFTMTNMPIGRFLSFLSERGLLESYMQKLIGSFNPIAAQNAMCRYTLSVDWRGYMYDCDFNQMLDLKVNHGCQPHIDNFDADKFNQRRIVTMMHCYGCTAGCGSSCGGAIDD